MYFWFRRAIIDDDDVTQSAVLGGQHRLQHAHLSGAAVTGIMTSTMVDVALTDIRLLSHAGEE